MYAGDLDGYIKNISAGQSTVNAGSSITVTFDVELSGTQGSTFNYSVYIAAPENDDGDPWTSQSWSSPASLVSGTQNNGRWTATVNIGSGAYTGNYITGVVSPSKEFDSGTPVPIFISGITPPPSPTALEGTISNFFSNSTTLLAGNTYDFYFDVNLTSVPSTTIMYSGSISAATDQDGEPWTQSQWWEKASKVSGTDSSGRWKVTLSIPASAYTGDYIFTAGQGVSKRIVASGNLSLYIKGVTPTPPFTASYVFSNQQLTSDVVVKGSAAEATFHLVTNDPQVQTPSCIIDAEGGNWTNAVLVSGNKMNGSWKCTGSVPSTMPPGTYDFHLVVIGYGNSVKNEERVILPLRVVATTAELSGPPSNNAYLTTSSVAGAFRLTSDSIQRVSDYRASSVPVGRIFIPAGSGQIAVSVSGPGLVGQNSNFASAAKSIVLNRALANNTNLYLFADGLSGTSTITINVSGQSNTKSVEFGTLGGAVEAPSATLPPRPLPSPSPTATLGTQEGKAKAYITTSDVQKTSELYGDYIDAEVSYVLQPVPVARIFIPPGSGTATVVVFAGPGLLNKVPNRMAGARAISIERSSTSASNTYLYADGNTGVATVLVIMNSVVINKSITFGKSKIPGAAPTLSPSPTPTPSATASPIAEPTLSETETAFAEASKLLISGQDQIQKLMADFPSLKSQLLKAFNSMKPVPTEISEIAAWRANALATIASVKKFVATQKETTLTCIKGKTTKKVTAIKPKCPTGFKKK